MAMASPFLSRSKGQTLRSERPSGGAMGLRMPARLDELFAQLLWPRLLSGWKLGLQPGRWLLCLIFVTAVFLAENLYTWLAKGSPKGPIAELLDTGGRNLGILLRWATGRSGSTGFGSGFTGGEFSGRALAADAVYELFIRKPSELIQDQPLATLLFLPLIVAGFVYVSLCVCRSCAGEVSLKAAFAWRNISTLSLRKLPAGLGALLGPLVMIWITGLLIWVVFGKLLFEVSWLAWLGGLLLPIAAIAAVAAAVMMVLYLLSFIMILPALACEGTDAFDSVQRAFAYVISRPAKLALYALVGLGVTAIAASFGLFLLIVAGQFLRFTSGIPLESLLTGDFRDVRDQIGGVGTAVARLLLAGGVLLLISMILSIFLCQSTQIYLCMRQVVDGQDVEELWVEARPEATAQVPAGSAASKEAAPPAPPASADADYT
jgi:hypothetical protein